MGFPTDRSSLNIIKWSMVFLNILFVFGLFISYYNFDVQFLLDSKNISFFILAFIMIFSNLNVFKKIKSIEKQNKI